MAVYIFAGVLTQVLPRGEYNTFVDENTGKASITTESVYSPLEDYTMPLWKIVAAPVMVFMDSETTDYQYLEDYFQSKYPDSRFIVHDTITTSNGVTFQILRLETN